MGMEPALCQAEDTVPAITGCLGPGEWESCWAAGSMPQRESGREEIEEGGYTRFSYN